MPVAAIAGAAAVSIGGSLLSASSSKKAAKNAAQAQVQIADKNNALLKEIYTQNQANLSPFMTRGNQAGDAINALLLGDDTKYQNAFNNYRNSTGYQFRLGEGMDAIQTAAASQGGLRTGDTLKALQSYGQNLASSEFGNYLGQLGNQQGVGLSGASALAGVGQNYANNVGQNNQSAADALSNSALLKGQANNQLYGNLASIAGSLFGSSYGG